MKKISAIVMHLCCSIICFPQNLIDRNKPIPSDVRASLDRRSVTEMQKILVFDLDSALPKVQFKEWFSELVGNRAGVIWQLSECGGGELYNDIPACAEVNAVLPDQRKVIVMVTIGGFRRGVISNPKFFYGVIDINGELYKIDRLSDLPNMLSDLGKSSEVKIQTALVQLPTISETYISQVIADLTLIKPVILNNGDSSIPMSLPESPLPHSPSLKLFTVADAVMKVQPQYPEKARKFNAQGTVKVQVLISPEGRVLDAKVLNGNPLLHDAAIDAARQWVFRAALDSKQSMITQLVLTFDFKMP